MINQILNKYFKTLPAHVEIACGLQDNIADIVTGRSSGKSFVVVSDDNTYKVLGEKVVKSLSGYKTASIVLKPSIADDRSVEKVRAAIKEYDAVIAVGSGTINDICKYASFCEKKPYMVFGTAPSMNGYSSANASISVNGHKKTLKAHLPEAIFLDIDILAAAPKRLILSGLGDSVCRPTAQADWLLSHLLLNTEYNTSPFEMLRPFEKDLFENSGELLKGNKEIIELLAQTLVLSGFGMYMCGGSYPASQGEHMIAHTMEMAYNVLPHSFHGEQIAVTTLAMSRIIEEKLQSIPIFSQNYDEKAITDFFGKEISEQCLTEYREKLFPSEKQDKINNYIATKWEEVCGRISEIFIGYDPIYKTLKNASAPVACHDIGWKEDKFKKAVSYAKYSRNRFTFLDL
ncbi:MAG: sn-glycerol-1-phosphate dehydrogenase [Rickettsiales bacterium]|nr:sn-glycerol-1-phosphate dehydrogenase [Pseudomonadota bacterium]MDA0965980.1 sn-glycerol-1-phosphate dehydrogenase [Pseudomonadota bacterium]MDG4542549.1 sn-glycerol-1-phosphate dehydrogenase [Rickettsiales bacterium]MDG4545053.1 sn-glycerol-1-phosphate dehydrogenase [Rickettsiales bacterium]